MTIRIIRIAGSIMRIAIFLVIASCLGSYTPSIRGDEEGFNNVVPPAGETPPEAVAI